MSRWCVDNRRQVLVDATPGAAAGACLRPDDSTSTAKTTATKSSAGTSPSRGPIRCPLPNDCTAMIAACTTLDHTVNQIRLRFACGFRAAFIKKTPSVAYTPTIIMKYSDWYGAPECHIHPEGQSTARG